MAPEADPGSGYATLPQKRRATVMRKKGERAKIDAMLRHLGCGHDLENFPGTRYEQLALVQAASSRGLVEWQEEVGRYELTPVGWRQLTPRRGLSLASLMVGTAIGATFGAAALAVIWLPGDVSHRSVERQAIALSRPVDARGGPLALAPVPQKASASRAAPVAPHAPAPGAQPDTPTEPAKVAEQPVPEEPVAEAVPTVVKQVAVKKPRHRTGTGPAWASTNPYRDERYSGFGRIVR
jgi:hypothetical protein